MQPRPKSFYVSIDILRLAEHGTSLQLWGNHEGLTHYCCNCLRDYQDPFYSRAKNLRLSYTCGWLALSRYSYLNLSRNFKRHMTKPTMKLGFKRSLLARLVKHESTFTFTFLYVISSEHTRSWISTDSFFLIICDLPGFHLKYNGVLLTSSQIWIVFFLLLVAIAVISIASISAMRTWQIWPEVNKVLISVLNYSRMIYTWF